MTPAPREVATQIDVTGTIASKRELSEQITRMTPELVDNIKFLVDLARGLNHLHFVGFLCENGPNRYVHPIFEYRDPPNLCQGENKTLLVAGGGKFDILVPAQLFDEARISVIWDTYESRIYYTRKSYDLSDGAAVRKILTGDTEGKFAVFLDGQIKDGVLPEEMKIADASNYNLLTFILKGMEHACGEKVANLRKPTSI